MLLATLALERKCESHTRWMVTERRSAEYRLTMTCKNVDCMALTVQALEEMWADDAAYQMKEWTNHSVELGLDNFRFAQCAVGYTREDCQRFCWALCTKVENYPVSDYRIYFRYGAKEFEKGIDTSGRTVPGVNLEYWACPLLQSKYRVGGIPGWSVLVIVAVLSAVFVCLVVTAVRRVQKKRQAAKQHVVVQRNMVVVQ